MGIAYNPFLDSEAGNARKNYEGTQLLKFWTEKIIEIDPVERERPSLGLTLEKIPEVRIENGKWKRHADYEFADCSEVAEAFMVRTSPCKFDWRSQGASETVINEG